MIDFFDSLYSAIKNKHTFLGTIRFYSFERFLVKLIGNITLPIYFKLTSFKKKYSLEKSENKEERIIVSLTSFPARIKTLWIVIETILRQEIMPDMIILWLSKEEFANLNSLPKSLLKLQSRGLTIRLFDGNLKSHKKYYYAMKEFPNDYIITVDDDVIYSSQLLSNLIKLNHKYPNAICCNHASSIKVMNGEILPYITWENVTSLQSPSLEIIPIGVGGVLYPPGTLYKDVLNKEIFMQYCCFADDIWLNIMSHLKGTRVAKTAYNSFYFPIILSQNKSLNHTNIDNRENDLQLNNLRIYYKKQMGIDPFIKIL